MLSVKDRESEDQSEGDGAGVMGEQRRDESAGGELDERGHPDERPVGMFGAERFDVDALESGERSFLRRVMRVVEMVCPAEGMPGALPRRGRCAIRVD